MLYHNNILTNAAMEQTTMTRHYYDQYTKQVGDFEFFENALKRLGSSSETQIYHDMERLIPVFYSKDGFHMRIRAYKDIIYSVNCASDCVQLTNEDLDIIDSFGKDCINACEEV